jgi:small subunit ribosomal protein S1
VNSNSPAESTTQPRQTKGGTLAPTLSPAAAAPSTPEPEEDFASMLAEAPQLMQRRFERGEQVEGAIVSIGNESAFVDLGVKAEASIAVAELLDQNGELGVKVGERISARVINFENGCYRLGRSVTGAGNEAIEEAFEAGLSVSGQVLALNKGGFEVQVMGKRAFCPISQIELGFTENPGEHVGKSYTFRITEFSKGGRRFVVSRAALQREEKAEKAAALRERIQPGTVLEGTVRSIQDFGAFVDLGGLDGLVHVSEISHSRVQHPSELLSMGQRVKVQILSIEQGEKGERLSLSIKRTQEDPWDAPERVVEPGQRIQGKVQRLAPFGAFVELAPGLEGLIHVSEMAWDKHVKHPEEILKVGESVDVVVLSVDAEHRRIGLSLKALRDDPWLAASHRFPVGQELTGRVEKVADFGVFVQVGEGIVGLLPNSESATKPGTKLDREFSPGDQIAVRILAVDEERRRLTLTRRDPSETMSMSAEPSDNRRGRRRGPAAEQRHDSGEREHREAGGNFATLGDVFAAQLRRKQK